MLVHTGIKGNIVILAPSTEWVKEKDWVFVSLLEELFTGIFEKEHVSVVEWVTNLEGVDGISTAGLDLFADFMGSESVFVHTVVEFDSLDEVHALS